MSRTATGRLPHPNAEAAGWGTFLRYLTGFVGFPLGGLVASVLGPVDDRLSAVLGGLAAGCVIGLAQWLALRHRQIGAAWIPLTGAGLAIGLTIGSLVVGYRTGLVDLLVIGAVSGTYVGLGQSLVLSRTIGRRASTAWALASSLTWTIGWLVTWAFGIELREKFAVFGASGALACSALGAALLVALLRHVPQCR